MAIKRRDPRVGLWIPVKVEGFDATGKAWDENSKSLDDSPRGVAFVVKHAVEVGQLVHLTLPLPRQFRTHDPSATTYRVYAVVASAVKVAAGRRVGAAFLGKDAPAGWGAKPDEKPPAPQR